MYQLNKKDFYIGAALYTLLQHNKDSKPSMIEKIQDSAFFTVTTNTCSDVGVYIKYSGHPTSESKRVVSWQIQLTQHDKSILDQAANVNKPCYLILVLGNRELSKTEIALLTLNEYNRLRLKSSFTIRKERGYYTIMYDYYPHFKVCKNRIGTRLEEINDSEIITYEKSDIII